MMAGAGKWLVLMAVLVIVLATVIYFDQKYVVHNVFDFAYGSFIEISKQFPDGSTVTHFVPDQPVDQKATPVQASSLIDEDSTEEEKTVAKAIEKTTTPIKGIPQYKKLDDKGIPISGYAILVDQVTGEHLKPYVYNVMVLIQCDDDLNLVDGFNFCSSDPVVGRVQSQDAGTDPETKEILGGFYEYIWRPNSANVKSGFYDVQVIVTSDQLDQRGTYKSYEANWKIQVI